MEIQKIYNSNYPFIVVFFTVILIGDTVFSQQSQEDKFKVPEFIAHRGASYLAPENTMASIKLAWEMDVDAVEIDVWLTADNEIVVFHDRTTRRIADRNRPVEEQTLEELRELDYGSWKSSVWEGEAIPTLDEALATLPRGKRMFIDVKSDKRIIKPMLEAFDRSGNYPHQMIVIAFSYELAEETKRLRPHTPVFWLVGFRRDDQSNEWYPSMEEVVNRSREANFDAVNVSWRGPAREPENIKLVREAGLGYYIWTVNSIEGAQRALELGVDGITTDRPAWLKKQLLSRNGWRLLRGE